MRPAVAATLAVALPGSTAAAAQANGALRRIIEQGTVKPDVTDPFAVADDN